MPETTPSPSAGMAHHDLKIAITQSEPKSKTWPKGSVKEFMPLYKIVISLLKLFGGNQLAFKEFYRLYHAGRLVYKSIIFC